MLTHIRYTGIVVADLKGAVSFWRDVLGFRVVRQMEESGSHLDALLGLEDTRVTTVKLAAPDCNLVELLHFHSHPDQLAWTGTPYSTGLSHISFTVDDLDSQRARLRDAGVTFFAAPQTLPDGNVKVTYGSGPDGLLLDLIEVLNK